MLQIAVCDDEKLYLNEVLKILHETLDGTPIRYRPSKIPPHLLQPLRRTGIYPI